MPERRFLKAILVLLGIAVSAQAHAELRFHWADEFSNAEQAKLKAWVRETHAALETLVGTYPFDIDIYMYRREGAGEPVPWANTRRGQRQGVNFHVDPSYPIDSFRHDWTAPHELSHLVLPHLDNEASWFAEGFASYMQYQVMQAMGVLSSDAVAQRYRANLERARRGYPYPDRPFAAAAPVLHQERRYPVMYWGGAAYFLEMDQGLQSSGSGMVEVLRKYLACCRDGGDSVDTVVTQFDRLAQTDAFSALLARFRTRPGFPGFEADPE